MFKINGFIQLSIFPVYSLKMFTGSLTEILGHFYKILIGVTNSTLQHHIKALRYFVCNKTVCPNEHI